MYYEYDGSRKVVAYLRRLTTGNEFYTLIMAAMQLADTDNLEKLRAAFPDTYQELMDRYNSPGGLIGAERI